MAAGLKKYHAKRKFTATPEPRGKIARKRGHAFVIQKHDATRLHYDLRLELDGVMKSWAVTRGPSLVPGEKRLAVEVEDHPIEYNKFEGTIPKGQYGGGTVMVWDRGHWEPEADPHRGLQKGHLAFRLEGEKLHGGWHLVRMHRRPNEKRNNWLLIKQHDDGARTAKQKDILEEMPLSVKTGRNLDEIAAHKRAAKRKAAKPAPPRKATPRRKKTAGNRKKAAAAAKKEKKKSSGVSRAALPGFVAPCLATLSDKAPSSAQWLHEIKFDGYRLQAHLNNGKATLYTRRGLDWTAKFSPIARAVAALPASTALIDGELVVEDDKGVSSFSLLQQALKAGTGESLVFYVFDLLFLDGEDLRATPLAARKRALAQLLSRGPKQTPLRLSESLDESGPVLLKHACRLGLEGIVSKLRDAPYRSGRGHDWLKTKCSDRQEFVVAGFTPSTADSRAIGSLVLGYYDHGKLHYAGRTGTGFTHQSAREIFRKLKALERDRSPFEKIPPEERGKHGAFWVEPKLVAEVDFHGWTHGDRVRQASFQGLREDKLASEVVRENKAVAVPAMPAKSKTTATKSKKPAIKAKPKADAQFGAVRLTHPDRVYWEDAGVTKQGLAEYYAKVWKHMAPHVTRRAISIVRCPEGAAGECFFQKHASAGIDATHLRLVREPDGDKIFSVDNLDGLIALAQGGALEIHLRGSTTDHLEKADRLIFDLDPGPGVKWPEIVAAARDVRARLEGIGLKTFIKTSGGKGLHVVLPIAPAPWEDVKKFCRTVAEAMAADEPEKYVASAIKAKRGGRIFVDYLRNSREATAIAPYSTRARPGAPVAMPITWSELGSLESASRYTVNNVMQRLGRLRKDPWAGIGKVKQALPSMKRR
jgi:bifunctional non-homologous end joining protein LigD